MTSVDLAPLVARVRAFEVEAHAILAKHEAARSRVVILEDTYQRLATLSLQQDDLLRQALRCSEQGLYRAAHVMAWAGFADFLFEKLASDGLTKLRAHRPKWAGKDIFEMAEYVPERQFVDVCRDLDLATKNEVKQMDSLLDRRNECAHPSAYYPDLNMTLGYISQLLQVIEQLRPRSL